MRDQKLQAKALLKKINDLIALLKEFSIIELARSGLVSIERGKK